MGQPVWSKIPFEKMPEWKRNEVLARSKKTVEVAKTLFVCDTCGKSFVSEHGMKVHKSKHK